MRHLVVCCCVGLSLSMPACSSSSSGGTTGTGGGASTGGTTDPCALLKPEEIGPITGGTAGAGTADSGSSTCHWNVTGSSATASTDAIEVTLLPIYFAKDSPNTQQPTIDVPEISANAYLSINGEFFMQAKGGALMINIILDKFTSLGNTDRLAQMKPVAAKLAALIVPRL